MMAEAADTIAEDQVLTLQSCSLGSELNNIDAFRLISRAEFHSGKRSMTPTDMIYLYIDNDQQTLLYCAD